MSNLTSPSVEAGEEVVASTEGINWGRFVFFFGLTGFLVSFASHYLPGGLLSAGLLTGACIVTLAAIASYIALFQTLGRKFAVWSMLIFSIASPVLFFTAFMSYME